MLTPTPALALALASVVAAPPADDKLPSKDPSGTVEPATPQPVKAEGPQARNDEIAPIELEVASSADTDVFVDPFGDGDESLPSEGGADDETPAESAGVSADDVDLSDVFGDSEEVELEELGEEDEANSESPSKWDAFDASVRIVSSTYMDIDNYIDGARWTGKKAAYGGFSRHETRIEMLFSYTPNEHIQIVGDLEPVFLYFPEQQDLNELTDRRLMSRYHVESDAAYVALNDILPGLDIKLGRQIVVWGTADKFNPTNNLNADDLEDRPLFTEPIANQMAVIDYTLPSSDKFWAQLAYVPFFTPALLPPSAATALLDPKTMPPYVNQEDRDAIEFLQGYIDVNPKYDPDIYADLELPENRFKNSQVGFKLGSKLGPVDLSASYYRGFHDIPMPVRVESTNVVPYADDQLEIPPEERFWYRSDVTLIYPKMQVIGLDFATQLSFLGNAGLWGEAGLFIPGDDYRLVTELPVPIDVTSDDQVANPIREIDGPVVGAKNGTATPYVKATVGMDYTIGKHVYLQGQYLRGFIDEFGAGNIGNYLVAGSELVFFGRHLILRTFAVVDFPQGKEDVSSTVIAPSLIMVPPWGFVTLELGGFAFLYGKKKAESEDIGNAINKTKFGQSAAGSSIVYLKVAGQF